MSNYTKTTDFQAKDSLPAGDSNKVIRGSEFETEFDNIATAVNSKADTANATLTGTTTFETISDGVINVTAFVDEDNMASNSATLVPTQQSVKSYVDSQITANNELSEVLSNGNTTGGSNISFGDNDKAIFGAGSDLQIYHDGSHSYITDQGTGDLMIDGTNVRLRNAGGANFLYAVSGGSVQMYHANASKLETTSSGIDVTGVITTDGMTTSADINFGDNDKAVFGAGSDLQIYHDGSNSVIKDAGAGNLKVLVEDLRINNSSDTAAILSGDRGGAVTLYNNGSTRLATTSTGIDVTGVITTDGMTTSADINFGDNDKAVFGAGSDLQIYHSGSHSIIKDAGTGHLVLQANDLRINNADWSANYISATNGDSVDLFFNNSKKLATTSTGIDVTGVIISDGANGISNDGEVRLGSGFSAYGKLFYDYSAGDLTIENTWANDAGEIYLKTNGNNRVEVSGNGDLSLFEDTGTTPKFFWDASAESLGIGTSSPSSKLQVMGGTSGLDQISLSSNLTNNNIKYAGIVMTNYGNTTTALLGGKAQNGTTSVYYGSSGSDHRGPQNHIFYTNASATATSGNTERMRIDSSGHLLVGKTSSESTNTVGFEVKENGIIAATADNSQPLILNRKTSDGTIAQFRKDNTTVGVVGTVNGDINIGTGDTGLRFHDGNDYIEPFNVSTNSFRDASIDLGTIGSRFKDLHLSGVAYITGTTGRGLKISNATESYTNNVAVLDAQHSQGILQFKTAGSEAARIDKDGNLLVGTTDSSPVGNNSDSGIALRTNGSLQLSRHEGTSLLLNRRNNDGEIIRFHKNAVIVGSIGTVGGDMYVGTGDTNVRFDDGADQIYPVNSDGSHRDGAIGLGWSGGRFDDIYATNGTIQTSDRNEKQDIAELSEAEQRVAIAAKGLLRKFRWKSSVADKGDEARIHFGIIAQDLQDAFTAEGLDSGRYAMFINSTWTDEETGEERSRMGVRYSELLAFIISAI